MSFRLFFQVRKKRVFFFFKLLFDFFHFRIIFETQCGGDGGGGRVLDLAFAPYQSNRRLYAVLSSGAVGAWQWGVRDSNTDAVWQSIATTNDPPASNLGAKAACLQVALPCTRSHFVAYGSSRQFTVARLHDGRVIGAYEPARGAFPITAVAIHPYEASLLLHTDLSQFCIYQVHFFVFFSATNSGRNERRLHPHPQIPIASGVPMKFGKRNNFYLSFTATLVKSADLIHLSIDRKLPCRIALFSDTLMCVCVCVLTSFFCSEFCLLTTYFFPLCFITSYLLLGVNR